MTYLQLGQLILSIDRAALPEGVTLYSFLKSWGLELEFLRELTLSVH